MTSIIVYKCRHNSIVPNSMGRPNTLTRVKPSVRTSWCIVPAAPLKRLGAISKRYIEATPLNRLHVGPYKNRPARNGLSDLRLIVSPVMKTLRMSNIFINIKDFNLETKQETWTCSQTTLLQRIKPKQYLPKTSASKPDTKAPNMAPNGNKPFAKAHIEFHSASVRFLSL